MVMGDVELALCIVRGPGQVLLTIPPLAQLVSGLWRAATLPEGWQAVADNTAGA